ncbi:hypothetical protein MKQ70_31805 [Chitinophaga sedimenti]|uniref:hypothetical protein n=1 Tax=Chitinophaga sedimenti TaxID=2033606 RepID=UPI002006D5C1|nr:hypothetical protein [Chitinophaga sedimenti]MCK7559305.1 hypothetical protein [Chitinophaga sedimenti]
MKTLTAHPALFKDDLLVDTQVSFVPFLRFLKDKVASSAGATASFYQLIIDKFESKPELLGPRISKTMTKSTAITLTGHFNGISDHQ